MSTFLELQKNLIEKKYKKAILDCLVEYLDKTFLIPAPEERMVLLTDDKLEVPEEAYDSIIKMLNQERKIIEEAVQGILNSTLTVNMKE